eukprot:3738333-Alexandrium_andersonii.AAC.1
MPTERPWNIWTNPVVSRCKGSDADAVQLAVPEEDDVMAEPGRRAEEHRRRRPRLTSRVPRTNREN